MSDAASPMRIRVGNLPMNEANGRESRIRAIYRSGAWPGHGFTGYQLGSDRSGKR